MHTAMALWPEGGTRLKNTAEQTEREHQMCGANVKASGAQKGWGSLSALTPKDIWHSGKVFWMSFICGAHTCSWGYQPAVQKSSSQRVVEDHGPLAVDSLQNVLHGDWGVGVGAASHLLACFLTLDEKVGEGSRAAPLGDGQRLVMPALVEFVTTKAQNWQRKETKVTRR